MQSIIILGYGNMAFSIVSGMLKNSALISKSNIKIAGRNKTKIKEFIKKLDKTNLQELEHKENIDIENAIIILCTKKAGFFEANFTSKALACISVMAGVKLAQIEQKIKAQNYIQVMPNVGAFVSRSANCVFAKNDANLAIIQEIIQSFGNFVLVENEELIDASIATSGSSIAFLALFAQGLIDSGLYFGLKREASQKLVSQTFSALGELLQSRSPQEIIELVTSPAGTTIEGLYELEKSGAKGALMKAAIASAKKAKN
ncbi:MAG: pyrroline-5-carboxylate reductase dimerization domain-containing protein [Helicobacter sp.]|nr:pyrroline-5-carboxylate reductase dimerization domain-containing protein [Helicobacter sp.]